MNLRQALVASSAAALLLWGAAYAQQRPSSGSAAQTPAENPPSTTQYPTTNPTTTANPSVTSSSANIKTGTEKLKRWSGNLVDISCMAKALSNQNGNANPGADTGQPHFMGSSFAGQAGQQPGGGMPPGGGAPGGQAPATAPTYPSQTSANPGTSPAEQAQMARAAKVDNAAKQCTASSATQDFGLAMSGGQVVQFDRDGNNKAQDALKEVEVQPGKRIKAKVTGTLENSTMVRVASVEVKGKRSGGSSATPGGGR
jgi:hypothetical protein